jgi:endonuclease YncB( thermonuclease family)
MGRYRRRGKYSFVSFIIFLLLVVATKSGWLDKPAQVAQSNQPGLYAVTKPVDGDTIQVDMNGHTETVRFIGIDTPETHKPNTPVQCYGPEAAAYTKSMVEGKQVRLQADPLDTNRDRYGRLLRYIYLPDGSLLQDQLVSQGYAFAYTQFPFQKKDQMVAEEEAAKQAGKGLWTTCQVTVESNGRKQTNSL